MTKIISIGVPAKKPKKSSWKNRNVINALKDAIVEGHNEKIRATKANLNQK